MLTSVQSASAPAAVKSQGPSLWRRQVRTASAINRLTPLTVGASRPPTPYLFSVLAQTLSRPLVVI